MLPIRNWTAIIFYVFYLTTANACVDPVLSQRDYYAIGVVTNSDGEIVYEEHHKHKADARGGTTQVNYKSLDNTLIAKKTIDYDCHASAPNYTLIMNQGEAWTEQVKWQSDQLIITQAQSEKTIDSVDSDALVIDAGFDNFIFENWQALISGDKKVIDFLHVPGNRMIRLVITLEADNPDIEIADDVALFKITTKSKLFRLFSDPIFLAYNKQSKQLDYYSGPTNLRGEIKGLEKSKQIAIKYRYN